MEKLMTDEFQQSLKRKGIKLEVLYEAMKGNDLCQPVLVATELLNKAKFFKDIKRDENAKSEVISNRLREDGNIAYHAGRYQLALECYNKALAFTPLDSESMALIYSNRSALLVKNLYAMACLNDIEKCLTLNCPERIKPKLLKRKNEAICCIWMEKLALQTMNHRFLQEFFKVHGDFNPDIPSITSNITITKESENHTILSANDINVGSVIAFETAFTTLLNEGNQYHACYYCATLSMNLFPCPGCSQVLFCTEACQKLSMNDGHVIECQFMDVVTGMNMPKVVFAFKSALKMKMLSKSWAEFIDASQVLGSERASKSTLKEIYDVNETFALLNSKEDSMFIHGKLYNCSFACAILLHFVSKVDNFLPTEDMERHDALCALMRITVHLYLYAPPMIVTPSASATKKVTKFYGTHSGSFPFMSSLTHSCHPNCLAACLNNKVALIAIEPINAGTELTVTKFGQFKTHPEIFSMNAQTFNRQLFQHYGTTCDCKCSVDKLSDSQKEVLQTLNLRGLGENSPKDVCSLFPVICKALSLLNNATHTEEYELILDIFLGCIIRAQNAITRNVVIDFHS